VTGPFGSALLPEAGCDSLAPEGKSAMSETMSDSSPFTPGDPRKPWHWHPELPIGHPPLFVWPPQPVNLLKWIVGRGVLHSQHMLYLGLAFIAWYATPSLERMVTFEAGWIAEIWLRNLVMFGGVTLALHLWFYTFRAQGDTHKFDAKPLATNNPKFLFGRQVWDNVVWSMVSGITIATVFEVVVWWFWANGFVGWFSWSDGPVWFVGLFVVVLVFEDVHFYLQHRLLHWKPLYRFHALHHHNVTTGPWSGLSMHPVEHVFYLSSLVFHLIVVSHPLHMLYHFFWLTTGASLGHTGFQNIDVKGKNVLDAGTLFHTLHHRFYTCNYGLGTVPIDKWVGSFHDGTAAATTRIMKQNLKLKAGMASAPDA
tara:strand:- start:12225 stop:13328 length:1104 start_codon:yes stop_codon:yes gene_type:complete